MYVCMYIYTSGDMYDVHLGTNQTTSISTRVYPVGLITHLNYKTMLEKTHNATGKSDTDNNNNNKDKTRFFVDISVKKKINQFNSLSFNGAKSFFEQSGILGPIKLKDSLILKTSKIHIDTDLLNQIRKKPLCFRPQICGGKNKEIVQQNYDDLLINLQNEICNVKEILKIGESKIITLNTEIIKIKGSLQKIMKVHNDAYGLNNSLLEYKNKSNNFCAFCQTRYFPTLEGS
ncbi:uncharacterized protein Dana_GF27521 [Drosophila ananassae]|uniref:Uncharacterized protein n=1 Tax=Drosophila ananassae TaxID=7217 RepID=A0A0P8XJI1_DROAN|nr:uncharacterized protein Dana_GF27521 [Drosophila ananassae]